MTEERVPAQHRILIVAVDALSGIAKNGNMPWNLPADMKHFRESTMGCPVIMGRKTYDTIGKPLKGRTTIVVTRDPDFLLKIGATRGVHDWNDPLIAASSIEEAFELVKDQPIVYLAGGLSIYEQGIKYCNQMLVTTIKADFDCDQTLVVQMDKWRTFNWRGGQCEKSNLDYVITTFERVAPDDEQKESDTHEKQDHPPRTQVSNYP